MLRKADALALNENDNVAVSLRELNKNEKALVIRGNEKIEVEIIDKIPYGHKFSLFNIKKGDYIIKYGEIIGIATSDIPKGAHVHVHNVKGLRAGEK
ncbi:altronate dehydratase [Caldisphaera lagunensis DSM 15908]|uniref:Altronate dehydratase n=1 Tax=Caldisphaera lagunensis (strain DSM 15908 / JCM 11604 / ANMR 0165 / IC-154) TaxID=1056495 RepID=L0AA60_CALLD|nr:UxaA family hydrolase [Caldisphaera lagunensis]AFZ69935.1 altronate dehydratase [Caldisphaera lagunensis DSM 15908]